MPEKLQVLRHRLIGEAGQGHKPPVALDREDEAAARGRLAGQTTPRRLGP